MEYKHVSVMLNEILEYLALSAGDRVVDCTFGGGGYTEAILKMVGDKGEVLAIDRDELAVKNGLQKFKDQKNLKIIKNRYSRLKDILDMEWGVEASANAIVMDLGLSSAQLDDRFRGFSFLHDSELKMEMSGDDSDIKTIDIVNSWSVSELERIFRDYGEERFSRRIAKKIAEYRKETVITRTKQLVDIIVQSVPPKYRYNQKTHFATRVFQALRIATNEELQDLENVLPQAMDVLASGGRLVIVSFHSLEDRIVKKFFKKESKDCICPPEVPLCVCDHRAVLKIITKKPVLPSDKEIADNPRSRSAKLRVAEKI